MIGWGLAHKRERALRKAGSDTALGRHLATPPPDPDTPTSSAPLLAVDLETTGLDPRRDQILSVGFVPVDGDVIDLSGAREIVVHADGEVGQSAVVHGLTDDIVAAGRPLPEVLDEVLAALTGRALLAHYATIEQDFLDAACRRIYGGSLPLRVVDTMDLQRRLTANPYDNPRGGTLRLGASREAHGLPVYHAHAALTDALACAELYLAQRAVFSERGTQSLGALSR